MAYVSAPCLADEGPKLKYHRPTWDVTMCAERWLGKTRAMILSEISTGRLCSLSNLFRWLRPVTQQFLCISVQLLLPPLGHFGRWSQIPRDACTKLFRRRDYWHFRLERPPESFSAGSRGYRVCAGHRKGRPSLSRISNPKLF